MAKRAYQKRPTGILSRVAGKQNPDYHKAHYELNREDRLAQQKEWRKRTNYKSPLTGSQYREMVISLLRQRDGHCCWICGDFVLEGEDQIDHVMLRSKGGTNNSENLKLAHSWCNMKRERT